VMAAAGTVVIGGGVVGVSIARALAMKGDYVTIIEKEGDLATHQTGRNSGVIHAGPYYKPGSLKARLCTEGNRAMVKFAKEHDIPFEVTGKLLLGTKPRDVERLVAIAARAVENNVDAELIGPERIQEIEPYASGLSALHVKSTGIIDYGAVTRKLAELSQLNGAEVLLNAEVLGITSSRSEVIVEHSQGVSRGICSSTPLASTATGLPPWPEWSHRCGSFPLGVSTLSFLKKPVRK
jgi:(S)-2-hydroxyglutarate dehydrogenase